MDNGKKRDSKYWCAQPLEEFLPRMFEHVDAFYDFVRARGFLSLWRASHKAAYAGWYTGGRLNDAGENLKFTTFEANEYANLKTHVINLITGSKSQPEAQAKSLDSKAQQQTVIAEALAQTVADEHQFDRKRQDVNECAWLYGEGWSAELWNPNEGDVYAIEMVQSETGPQQVPVYTGKLAIETYHPLDVIRDIGRFNSAGECWRIFRRPRNRYDLLAEHPELEDRIMGLQSWEEATQEGKRPRLVLPWQVSFKASDSDEVAEYVYVHDRTKAMPEGRLVHAFSDELALYEGPLPYRKLPGNRCCAGDIPGTIFGYTIAYDLLAPQQGLNAAVSALTTRIANFGVPTLWGPDGCKIQLTRLGEGLAILEGGQVKPEMLDFSNIPPELTAFVKLLRDLMATYSGINNVARGQSEGGITAASALALLEARAIQFVGLAQKADVEWQRASYNAILHNYQDFGDAEFIVRVAGEGNRSRAQKFTNAAISDVDGYTINLGNPLQSTTAGRMQLIEGAKGVGVQFTQEQYWQVMSTGRLDPVTEGPTKEMELIRAENESMSNGQDGIAALSDNHPLHIMEHTVVLADPETRKPGNAQTLQIVLGHIQEHVQLWTQATMEMPALLAAKSIPPAPMPMPPPGMTPPPQPGAPSSTSAPTPGKISKSVGPLKNPPGNGPVEPRVQQAQPAKNPLTGAANPHPALA